MKSFTAYVRRCLLTGIPGALFLTLLFSLSGLSSVSAQSDTEFWFAAPEISSNGGSNFDKPIVLRITTLALASTVTVDQPANPSFVPITINIAANSVGTVDLTPWIATIENTPANTALNYGLRITATNPVSAYYEVVSGFCNCNPEIFALKGSNALGNSFYVPFQTYLDNGSGFNPAAASGFVIVATQNNTNVTITPTANLIGRPAGVPYTITLQQGESYAGIASSAAAAQHAAGTQVVSNRPIAITMYDDLLRGGSYGPCADLLGDQIIPVNKLGNEYVVIRGQLNGGIERAFVVASENNTQVNVNGSLVATINAGDTYMVTFSTPEVYISTSENVYLLHLSGNGCEVGGAILPPLSCSGSSQLSVARSNNQSFILTFLVKNGGQGNFLFNGNTGVINASDFTVVPNTGGVWYAAKISISTAQLASGQAGTISNSSDIFQMGLIHGGSTSGTRYGYFSGFSTINVIAGANSPVCAGQSIQLNATTIPGVTYAWTGPGGFSSSLQNPNIPSAAATDAGSYTVVANDGVCTASSEVAVDVSTPPVISCPGNITANATGSACAANVSFAATATGDPSPTITYSHAPGSSFPVGTTAVTATATNSCGSVSCTFTVTVNETEPPVITCPANATLECNSTDPTGVATAIDNCGSVTISSSDVFAAGCGQTGTITRTWTATDDHSNSSSCVQTINYVDNTPPAISCPANISVSNDPGQCGAAVSFSATATDDCGSTSIVYSHVSGSVFPVGTTMVTATATDACNNTASCTFEVTVGSAPIVVNLNSPAYSCGFNVSCNGSSDGSVNSSVTGGCGQYSYNWSNNATTANIGNLPAGTYTVTVTDANNNTATASITLTQPDPLTTALSSPTYNGGWNISCNGYSDGSINSVTAGGCQPYSYNWSNGSTMANPGSLLAGTYSVTVTDANNCTATASVTLSQPPVLTAEAGANATVHYPYNNANCTTLSGSQTGGTLPYAVSWSDGSSVIGTSASIQVCPTVSTVYYYTTVDANGCTSTDSVKVCVINVLCNDRTNNGQGGNGQGGNGQNNGQGGGNGLVHISICHIPPGNSNKTMTKCLPQSAVASHLAHGDYLGACGSNTIPCEFGGSSKMESGAATLRQFGEADFHLEAFPNPTNGTLAVNLECHDCSSEGVFEVKLLDMMGHTLSVKSMNFFGGASKVDFDLSAYAQGFYMVMVNTGSTRLTRKIMKN